LPQLRQFLLIFLVSLVFEKGAAGGRLSSGIVSPSADDPVVVKGGSTISAKVRMALPLTPPPGVQLEKVWKDWTMTLSRPAAMVEGSAAALVFQRGRVVSIRSANGADEYEVLVEVSPLTPPGLYSLTIAGPGHSWAAASSVEVREQDIATADRAAIEIQQQRGDTWQLRNTGDKPWNGELEVVISGGDGVRIQDAAGKPLRLIGAAFARCTRDCSQGDDRLLRFRAFLPPGVSQLRMIRVPRMTPPPVVRIMRADVDKRLAPIETHRLKVVAPFQPISVLWDFHDGHAQTGLAAAHRWTDSLSIRASGHVFDPTGAVWTASFRARLDLPLSREGCGCVQGCGGRRNGTLLKLMLFSCIDVWLRE